VIYCRLNTYIVLTFGVRKSHFLGITAADLNQSGTDLADMHRSGISGAIGQERTKRGLGRFAQSHQYEMTCRQLPKSQWLIVTKIAQDM